MDDRTIADEIERWLRENARASEHTDTEDRAADAPDPAQDQGRPYWPYLDSEDFWRE